MSARVELRDVGHGFTSQAMLFRHLNAVLEPAHVYALTGPSGSGNPRSFRSSRVG